MPSGTVFTLAMKLDAFLKMIGAWYSSLCNAWLKISIFRCNKCVSASEKPSFHKISFGVALKTENVFFNCGTKVVDDTKFIS